MLSDLLRFRASLNRANALSCEVNTRSSIPAVPPLSTFPICISLSATRNTSLAGKIFRYRVAVFEGELIDQQAEAVKLAMSGERIGRMRMSH